MACVSICETTKQPVNNETFEKWKFNWKFARSARKPKSNSGGLVEYVMESNFSPL